MPSFTQDLTGEAFRTGSRELLPTRVEQLKTLVRVPSIATDGFPAELRFEVHDLSASWLQAAGVTDNDRLGIPDRTAPVITATVPGPPGTSIVLFHTHDDVVPVGDLDRSGTGPVERDGAAHGRGTSDATASILGTLRLFDGHPPVTLKMVLEGQEEVRALGRSWRVDASRGPVTSVRASAPGRSSRCSGWMRRRWRRR